MLTPSKPSPCVGIRTCSDYSPFGVELDGRTVSGGYRFGFQNQEKDDEIKGEGNSINYCYRMHDPRLGRFFAVDPLYNNFPSNSTYMFSENKLIQGIELEGLQVAYVYNVVGYGETKKLIKSHNESNYQDFNQRVYRYYNGQGEIYKELVQKLDSKGNVISYQFKRFPVDGNPITKNNEPSLLTSLKGEKPKPFYENTSLESGALSGGSDGANTANNSASNQAPHVVKAIVGLNPIITIMNSSSVLIKSVDIYDVKSTNTDKITSGISLVLLGNPFARCLKSESGEVIDFSIETTLFLDEATKTTIKKDKE